jgi:hypothetical protein
VLPACVGAGCSTTAGAAYCSVQLHNSGNIRLANVSVTGHPNDCLFDLMWPSDVVLCNMTRCVMGGCDDVAACVLPCHDADTWLHALATIRVCRVLTQADYEAGETRVEATAASATPLGLKKTLDNAPSDIATVVLLARTPALDVNLVTDKGFVAAAGEG